MSYQKFDSEKSSSNSHGKFDSLKLDEIFIKDQKVIDIGCNEGYFCFKLAELGAKSVIGIDKNDKWVNLANKRNTYDNVEFINGDIEYLKTLDDESCDIILILSAMHYMCNPIDRDEDEIPTIINEVVRLLKAGGIFIFEGGVCKENIQEPFLKLKRNIGDTVYHVTEKHLLGPISSKFSEFYLVGSSVKQGGDPIDRFVYRGIK